MSSEDNFSLVPKSPGALEKAESGAKHILSGMIVDTLALAKKEPFEHSLDSRSSSDTAGYIPPNEYFDRYYLADFGVFGGDTMCGFSLSNSLRLPKRERFKGLAEFVVCQFELNLLNQAIYTHYGHVFPAWCAFSAPFADTRLCFLGHGMSSHVPHAILRFAQQPFETPDVAPVSLDWEILGSYNAFFFDKYISRFLTAENSAGFSRESFLQSVARDQDCVACVLARSGWETRHVIALLRHEHSVKVIDL